MNAMYFKTIVASRTNYTVIVVNVSKKVALMILNAIKPTTVMSLFALIAMTVINNVLMEALVKQI